MCYDIKASLEAQLSRAKRKGDQQAIEEIIEKLVPLTDLPIHHAAGFSHPELLIYTDRSPFFPEVATWGLVPHWVKDANQQEQLWNSTLNARGETIFSKPSFRYAAEHYRCLITIDGFYEHHHANNTTYPFFVYRKDKQPITLGGLWSEWHNPATNGRIITFSIVTTSANRLLTKIHNNPKLKGPRMPLILPDELQENWLQPMEDPSDQQLIEELIKAYPDNELTAHTVARLRGKSYAGNVEGVSEVCNYPELTF